MRTRAFDGDNGLDNDIFMHSLPLIPSNSLEIKSSLVVQ